MYYTRPVVVVRMMLVMVCCLSVSTADAIGGVGGGISGIVGGGIGGADGGIGGIGGVGGGIGGVGGGIGISNVDDGIGGASITYSRHRQRE